MYSKSCNSICKKVYENILDNLIEYYLFLRIVLYFTIYFELLSKTTGFIIDCVFITTLYLNQFKIKKKKTRKDKDNYKKELIKKKNKIISSLRKFWPMYSFTYKYKTFLDWLNTPHVVEDREKNSEITDISMEIKQFFIERDEPLDEKNLDDSLLRCEILLTRSEFNFIHSNITFGKKRNRKWKRTYVFYNKIIFYDENFEEKIHKLSNTIDNIVKKI
jgi:hypothetical protein